MTDASQESSRPSDEPPSRLEDLLEWLHRRPSEFRDERLAPPVDHELLRALARHELKEDAARPLFHLVHSFRSWRDAYRESLIEEFRRASDEDAAGDNPLP
jgi:hypothetical protein